MLRTSCHYPHLFTCHRLDETLETTKIHSIVGFLAPGQALITRRSFRAPHHTASDAGLLGGNIKPAPGEISLAHHGVLFLDKLPEFKRSVLETMRHPLEKGRVPISRAPGTMSFPSQFMLVAAMNRTPDGKMPGESRSSPPVLLWTHSYASHSSLTMLCKRHSP